MGANQGGAKGNKQEAEYEEPGEKTRETRSEGTGRAKEAKAERAHWGSHCEAEAGRKRKGRNRKPSSRRRKRSGRKKVERKRKRPKAKA